MSGWLQLLVAGPGVSPPIKLLPLIRDCRRTAAWSRLDKLAGRTARDLPDLDRRGGLGPGHVLVERFDAAARLGARWRDPGLNLEVNGQPFRYQTWAYAIPVKDGAAQFAEQRRLPFGPLGDLAIDGGRTVLLNGTEGYDPALWKRYRGGAGGPGVGLRADGRGQPGRIPPDPGRCRRAVLQPDAGRRTGRLHQRSRRRRQHLLVRARRISSFAAERYRSRRVLCPQRREHRRHPRRLPARR